MERINIFISSSKKHVQIANAVKKNIETENREIKVWDEQSFTPAKITIDSLLREVNQSDFAIFVLAPDDKIILNDYQYSSTRDNVIFEYGMFISRLGKNKCFAIIPNQKDFRIPSDLDGVTMGKYTFDEDYKYSDFVSSTKTASIEISDEINKHTLKKKEEVKSESIQDFLGIHNEKNVAIFYHCEELQKYYDHHVDTTPGSLESALRSNMINFKCDRIQTDKYTLTDLQTKALSYDTIFIVDSPPYNTLSEDILQHSRTYLSGMLVNPYIERDLDGKLKSQTINIDSEGKIFFDSNKKAGLKASQAFGDFYDHFVIMRLPIIPTISDFKTKKLSLIWIIYGIHTKGTHAGLSLFKREEIEHLMDDVSDFSNRNNNGYFEIIFHVPEKPDVVNRREQVTPVHKSLIKLKSELALQDPTPSGLAFYFSRKNSRYEMENIPLQTVHLDICAGCNYNCPTCIESTSRGNKKILTLEKISSILCDLKKAGCTNINFYGGEPTLHPDFHIVNRLVQTMGFQSLLVTNGSQLQKEEIVDSILLSETLHIRISIDGNSNKNHKINHGLKNPDFDYIISSIDNLLDKINNSKKNIPVSISYLLHENAFSPNELFKAVQYWKSKKGIVSFHPRPLEDFRGTKIHSNIWKHLAEIKILMQTYGTFVVIPDWLKRFIEKWDASKETEHTINQKTYNSCYSSFYRIVISPAVNGRILNNLNIATRQGDIELKSTDEAWISCCSYRRYDTKTGCNYPTDFNKWMKKDRIALAQSIIPNDLKSFCNSVICCRHQPNRQVEKDIKEFELELL